MFMVSWANFVHSLPSGSATLARKRLRAAGGKGDGSRRSLNSQQISREPSRLPSFASFMPEISAVVFITPRWVSSPSRTATHSKQLDCSEMEASLMACLYRSNEDERLFGKGVGKEKQLCRLEIVFVLSTGINGNYDCCSCATRGLSHHGCWCVTTSDILSLISFQLIGIRYFRTVWPMDL